MLVRYPDRFHIIRVGPKLDDRNEDRILSGGCSDAVIHEMGLDCETVMTDTLISVAVGGCLAGDTIILHAKERRRQYQLSDDYEEAELDGVFAGVKRTKPPKQKKSSRKADWREEMQDPKMQKLMGLVGDGSIIAGAVCFLGTGFFGRMDRFWTLACLVVMAVSFGVYLRYPQYFSIMGKRAYKEAGYRAKVTQLDLAIILPACMLTVRSIWDHYYPNWTHFWIISGIVGVGSSIFLYFFSREIRENIDMMVVVTLVAVFLSLGIVGQVNHLANLHGEPVTCRVVETKKIDGGKRDRYVCTVAMPSGEEIELPMGVSTYRHTKPGDEVQVYLGQGALGLEYGYLVDED
ncbi:MAG: hypothetical protein IJW45_05195 [Oscillospiraceae bacterium]|nr:hypothetical protein [Oscillospiraceae bacterium]